MEVVIFKNAWGFSNGFTAITFPINFFFTDNILVFLKIPLWSPDEFIGKTSSNRWKNVILQALANAVGLLLPDREVDLYLNLKPG